MCLERFIQMWIILDLIMLLCLGDIEIALVKGDYVEKILNKDLCPLYLSRTKDFIGWLEARCIDLHRTNSRILKKALRLKNCEAYELVLKVNAVTLTDNYWVKKVGDNKTWEGVYVNDDSLYNIALVGLYEDVGGLINTYELTNIGSYEKCWKLIDNKWNLIKVASFNEKFSELFIERLGLRFGYDMTKYLDYETGLIRSVDFTEHFGLTSEFNFEPIHSIVGDEVDYDFVVQKLLEFDNGKKLLMRPVR